MPLNLIELTARYSKGLIFPLVVAQIVKNFYWCHGYNRIILQIYRLIYSMKHFLNLNMIAESVSLNFVKNLGLDEKV